MTPTLETLDLEGLPSGAVSRCWVEIAHDALGQPECIPVLVARGRPGPVVGLTAAVHGNELNGIPVLHRLFDRIDTSALRGTVVGVPVVNVPGFHRGMRRFVDDQDLNHAFPGRPDGSVSDVWVHRLLERIVRRFDVLLDLHTASFGRVNCLYVRADMSDPATARMAFLQRPQIIVHNPANDRTLRGAAAAMGIPAITVEIGDPHRFQERYIKRTITGIRAVLQELGLVPRRPLALGDPPVVCGSSGWMHTDTGGLLTVLPSVTDTVARGEVVGRVVDVFGQVVREYRAPHDGVVIGHSVDPVARTGSRLVHLGRVATEEDSHLILSDDVVVTEVFE